MTDKPLCPRCGHVSHGDDFCLHWTRHEGYCIKCSRDKITTPYRSQKPFLVYAEEEWQAKINAINAQWKARLLQLPWQYQTRSAEPCPSTEAYFVIIRKKDWDELLAEVEKP